MSKSLSREELRAIDSRASSEYGLSVAVLMENAGRGAADWLLSRLGRDARVLVACGPGNNGGDGAVVARHLDAEGVSVRVVWVGAMDSFSADALLQHRILERAGVDERFAGTEVEMFDWAGSLESVDWVVDALLGTGISRAVGGAMAEAITAINRSGRAVLALDIPSGLDADSGVVHGLAVRASATMTFVAPKIGFCVPEASSYLGEVIVGRIGVPRRLLEEFGVSSGASGA